MDATTRQIFEFLPAASAEDAIENRVQIFDGMGGGGKSNNRRRKSLAIEIYEAFNGICMLLSHRLRCDFWVL